MVTVPDHDPLLGQTVGSYRVERLIGKGGMGAVYLAIHKAIKKRVALKVLLPEFTARADLSARFVQEAMSASHVLGPNGHTHRNVVEPEDTGTLPDGRHFIMVEFLEGLDLEEYSAQRGGRLAEDEVLAIVFQTCAALYAADRAGIVHRDLKPANLFITRDDAGRQLVKLLDFGIAKVASAVRATGVQTGAGSVMGSPAYMAPEQVRTPLAVDGRADIYALGVVMYQLLTGRLPHHSDTVMGYVLAKMEQTPAPISSIAPDVSRLWDLVVGRCLEVDPARRYPNARAVVDALTLGAQSLPALPEAGAMLALAWPTFYSDGGPQDETRRAIAPSAFATPPPPQHATGGTLASAAGVRMDRPAARSRWTLAAAGVAIAIAAAGGTFIATHRSSRGSTAPAPSPAAAPTTATPAPSSTAAPITATPAPSAATAPTTTATPAPSSAAPTSTATLAPAPAPSSTAAPAPSSTTTPTKKPHKKRPRAPAPGGLDRI